MIRTLFLLPPTRAGESLTDSCVRQPTAAFGRACPGVLVPIQWERGRGATVVQALFLHWRGTALVRPMRKTEAPLGMRCTPQGRKAQTTAGLRFTSTMPAATSASAASSPGVTGSPSHPAPASNANTGVRKTNTEIFVAG